ncbi:MAG: hypothetical protein WCO76_07295 [Planctomycetota bacterium]
MTAPLARSASALAAAAAATSGLVLAARRLAGGFAAAEPGLVWITLGGGLVLLGITDAGRRAGSHLASSVAARIGLVIGVAAVALPPKAGDWVSILAIALAAAVGVLPPPRMRSGVEGGRRRPPATQPRISPRGNPRLEGQQSRVPAEHGMPSPTRREEQPPVAPSAPASLAPEGSPEPPGRLQQRLERYESAEGTDCISGHVRLSIPAGGKATHAHVGFCPAFVATPLVQVSTEYDGVEAVVTAAEVLPWGVRIECRLSEPAEEPLEIPVDLVAKSSREGSSR